MNLVPWRNRDGEKKDAIATVPKTKELAPVESAPVDDVVIYQGNPLVGRPRGEMVQVRPKALKIAGKVYNVDPRQLIRMIKQVTQTIGEYKDKENPYSGYVIGALRKARSDMVSDLESHFNIHWEIDEHTGRSVFYM